MTDATNTPTGRWFVLMANGFWLSDAVAWLGCEQTFSRLSGRPVQARRAA